MEATITPVDEPLIRALHLDAPYRIADIGGGAGGSTLEILRRAPGSVVHDFDISPALIELARARKQPDERAIAFEIAAMATAIAPEEPYDRLASRFGIMFFDDPPAAFANLFYWLAPSGRFAFAVWGCLAEKVGSSPAIQSGSKDPTAFIGTDPAFFISSEALLSSRYGQGAV
jgi:trans-aconitate methyltransferase